MELDAGAKPATVARREPSAGLYYLAAVTISVGIAVFEYVFWLSIAGHDTLLPLVVRCSTALCLGLWAGGSRTATRPWWSKFLGFEIPQLLLINSWGVVSFVATPGDPATLPFLLVVFGLSLGDLVLWLAGWAGAARIRARPLKME